MQVANSGNIDDQDVSSVIKFLHYKDGRIVESALTILAKKLQSQKSSQHVNCSYDLDDRICADILDQCEILLSTGLNIKQSVYILSMYDRELNESSILKLITLIADNKFSAELQNNAQFLLMRHPHKFSNRALDILQNNIDNIEQKYFIDLLHVQTKEHNITLNYETLNKLKTWSQDSRQIAAIITSQATDNTLSELFLSGNADALETYYSDLKLGKFSEHQLQDLNQVLKSSCDISLIYEGIKFVILAEKSGMYMPLELLENISNIIHNTKLYKEHRSLALDFLLHHLSRSEAVYSRIIVDNLTSLMTTKWKYITSYQPTDLDDKIAYVLYRISYFNSGYYPENIYYWEHILQEGRELDQVLYMLCHAPPHKITKNTISQLEGLLGIEEIYQYPLLSQYILSILSAQDTIMSSRVLDHLSHLPYSPMLEHLLYKHADHGGSVPDKLIDRFISKLHNGTIVKIAKNTSPCLDALRTILLSEESDTIRTLAADALKRQASLPKNLKLLLKQEDYNYGNLENIRSDIEQGSPITLSLAHKLSILLDQRPGLFSRLFYWIFAAPNTPIIVHDIVSAALRNGQNLPSYLIKQVMDQSLEYYSAELLFAAPQSVNKAALCLKQRQDDPALLLRIMINDFDHIKVDQDLIYVLIDHYFEDQYKDQCRDLLDILASKYADLWQAVLTYEQNQELFDLQKIIDHIAPDKRHLLFHMLISALPVHNEFCKTQLLALQDQITLSDSEMAVLYSYTKLIADSEIRDQLLLFLHGEYQQGWIEWLISKYHHNWKYSSELKTLESQGLPGNEILDDLYRLKSLIDDGFALSTTEEMLLIGTLDEELPVITKLSLSIIYQALLNGQKLSELLVGYLLPQASKLLPMIINHDYSPELIKKYIGKIEVEIIDQPTIYHMNALLHAYIAGYELNVVDVLLNHLDDNNIFHFIKMLAIQGHKQAVQAVRPILLDQIPQELHAKLLQVKDPAKQIYVLSLYAGKRLSIDDNIPVEALSRELLLAEIRYYITDDTQEFRLYCCSNKIKKQNNCDVLLSHCKKLCFDYGIESALSFLESQCLDPISIQELSGDQTRYELLQKLNGDSDLNTIAQLLGSIDEFL